MYSGCMMTCRIDKNTFPRAWLGLFWCAGLALGLMAERFYGDMMISCVRLAPKQLPTFLNSLSVNAFPLLISAIAVLLFRPALFLIALLRGLCMGLSMGAVVDAYGNAGLMMSLLLMFSSLAFAPVMLWYWCRNLEKDNGPVWKIFLYCLFASLIIAGMDVFLMAPFLCEVMNI